MRSRGARAGGRRGRAPANSDSDSDSDHEWHVVDSDSDHEWTRTRIMNGTHEWHDHEWHAVDWHVLPSALVGSCTRLGSIMIIWVVPTYDIVYDISVNVSGTITHIGVTIVTII